MVTFHGRNYHLTLTKYSADEETNLIKQIIIFIKIEEQINYISFIFPKDIETASQTKQSLRFSAKA